MPSVLINKTFVKTSIASAVVALCFNANAAVQEKSKQEKKIEKITVVGATTNSEITPLELENYQANDLEDIFRHTPSANGP